MLEQTFKAFSSTHIQIFRNIIIITFWRLLTASQRPKSDNRERERDKKHLYLILSIVSVHPLIQVPNMLVGAPLGVDITIVCNVEASPKAINYWQRENGK